MVFFLKKCVGPQSSHYTTTALSHNICTSFCMSNRCFSEVLIDPLCFLSVLPETKVCSIFSILLPSYSCNITVRYFRSGFISASPSGEFPWPSKDLNPGLLTPSLSLYPLHQTELLLRTCNIVSVP